MDMSNGATPEGAHSYRLELAGDPVGHFTACSGLQDRHGAGANLDALRVPQFEIRTAGLGDVTSVLFAQGTVVGRELWNWYSVVPASLHIRDRQKVVVVETGADGVERQRWIISSAWVSGWEGDAPARGSATTPVSALTLSYDGNVHHG